MNHEEEAAAVGFDQQGQSARGGGPLEQNHDGRHVVGRKQALGPLDQRIGGLSRHGIWRRGCGGAEVL